MELKFNVTGSERKNLAGAIAEALGTSPEYQGMPTAAYKIGGYILDKKGTLTGEYNLGLVVALGERGFEAEQSESFHLITPRGTLLIQKRFDSPQEAEDDGFGMYFTHEGRDIYTKPNGKSEHGKIFAVVGEPFEQEPPEPDCLSIEYPLEGFTPESRINLEKLVESKAVLIKQALGAVELPIIETDSTLKFPWFPAESSGDEVNAYAQFICALCDTAKKKKRVVAKPQEDFENPRFTMRVWLISLGLIGKDYGLCRKLMMTGLSGDSGWRYGKPEKADSVTESEGADNE